MFCAQCGTPAIPIAKFCSKCGIVLDIHINQQAVANESSPQASVVTADAAIQTPRHYVGIQRLPYLGIMIGLAIVHQGPIARVAAADSSGVATLMVTLLFIVVCFISAYYRLKNIGMNPWWCLLILVPIAHLLVVIRCLAFQEGYADTKKLDTAGKVIIVLGFFVLVIVAVVINVMGS